MTEAQLCDLYSEKTSEIYDQWFLVNDHDIDLTEWKVTFLKSLLDVQSPWLDVACGTGYFLSRFPSYKRMGVDLSPSMLKKAKQQNPDVEFEIVNFKHPNEHLQHKWGLVSCMWGAYCYVDSVAEGETVIKNLISWVKEGGILFLPLLDLFDLRPNSNVNFIEPVAGYGGTTKITSCTWTWTVAQTGEQHDLLSLSSEYILDIIAPYFDRIEIRRFIHPTKKSERIIVAYGKKEFCASKPAIINVCEIETSGSPELEQQTSDPSKPDVQNKPFVKSGLLGRLRNFLSPATN